MRIRDVLWTGLAPFRRQKLRSLLTTVGVAIGIATLVASVSVGVGVRQIIEDGFKRQSQLREIQIYPGYEPVSDEFAGVPPERLKVEGTMDDARRERLKRQLAKDWRMQQAPPMAKPLTPARLEQLAQIEHVTAVAPMLEQRGRVILKGRLLDANCVALTSAPERLNALLVAGRIPAADGMEVALHEYLLYNLGVRDDAALQAVLGQELIIEFTGSKQRRPELLLSLFNADASQITEAELQILGKARDLLPQAIAQMPLSEPEKKLLQTALSRQLPKDPNEKIYPSIKRRFTVVGVFRNRSKEEEKQPDFPGAGVFGEVILSAKPATEFFIQAPHRSEEGFRHATLTVDDDANLKEVCNQLKSEGYQFFAIGLYLQAAKKNALLIGFTMDFVALIALGVAFLGIMNTMFTAVLERTREIGVMKSVGAKDRQILLMFLIEGTMIGAIGGGLGLLIGWLVSFPGDHVALGLIREQDPNMPPVQTVFRYPWWLLVGAPLFAMMVTTLAGVLPARRAARIEPVVALRHE